MLSIIFLTYNRSELLARAFRSLTARLSREVAHEIIISDDASDAAHRAAIAELNADGVIWARRNRGLSHSHNRAIEACRHPYILSLQDDWEYIGTVELIASAMQILEEDDRVGAVNFLPPPVPLPCAQRTLRSGARYFVFENDGEPRIRGGHERPYSDRPHIKRAAFARDLGPYREDMPMTRAELEFQKRVACQSRWRIAYIENAASFVHLGAEKSFNPGYLRQKRVERLQALPAVGPLYALMRRTAKRVLRRA